MSPAWRSRLRRWFTNLGAHVSRLVTRLGRLADSGSAPAAGAPEELVSEAATAFEVHSVGLSTAAATTELSEAAVARLQELRVAEAKQLGDVTTAALGGSDAPSAHAAHALSADRELSCAMAAGWLGIALPDACASEPEEVLVLVESNSQPLRPPN